MINWARVNRAMETYRRAGGKGVLDRLCSYGIMPCWMVEFASYDIYRLEKFRRIPNRHDAAIDIGFASANDISEIASLTTEGKESEQQETNKLFHKFFARKGRCVAIRKEGRIVAYQWLFREKYPLSRDGLGSRTIDIKLGDGVFKSNGYIAPEFRLKGLFPLMERFIVDSVPESTPVYTHIEKSNDASKKAHERLGFRIVGDIEYWRLAGLSHFWVFHLNNRVAPVIARKAAVHLGELFEGNSAYGPV